MELLEELGLTRAAINIKPYVKRIVLEFYANLSKDICDATSDDVYLAYIHGHLISFSPHEINNYVGLVPPTGESVSISKDLIIDELTGGKMKKWPAKGGLRAFALTHKYSILHKIGLKNWVPTTNHSKVAHELAEFLDRVGTKSPMNFGQMVFDHVGTYAYKKRLGFPSLIFGIIQNQEDVVTPEDV